jgi:flagellin
LQLNEGLTAGTTTTVSAGGATFSFTAATTGQVPTNQINSATTNLTASSALASGSVLTVTRAGGTTIYTATAATTVGALENVINGGTAISGTPITVTGTDAAGHTGYSATIVAGSLQLTDLNGNNDISAVETGDPNTNQVTSSLATLTTATVLASGDVVTITRGAGAAVYTASAATTVGNLINAINTGVGTNIVVSTTGTGAGAVSSGLGAAILSGSTPGTGHLIITDSNNSGNVAVIQGTGAELGTFADTVDKTFAAPFINPTGSSSTVQTLVNAINSDTVVGAKAALVNGLLQVTDPFDRGDIAVTTTDTILGAVVSGAQTSFVNTTIGSSAPNANELVSNAGTSGTPLTATTTLAAGSVTSFTAGGKTFTYTAPTGGSTIGALISAIDNPLTDPANLQAYIGTVGSAAGQLVVVDPLDNNNLAVGPTNANTALGTFSSPVTTASPTTNIFLSDSTAVGSSEIAVTIGSLNTASITNGSGTSGVNLAGTDLNTQGDAQAALIQIGDAIANIASVRGTLGAVVNRLTAAGNVLNSQIINLTSAESTITSADIPTVVANLTSESILEQTGISALAQSNQQQQLVLKLLQ